MNLNREQRRLTRFDHDTELKVSRLLYGAAERLDGLLRRYAPDENTYLEKSRLLRRAIGATMDEFAEGTYRVARSARYQGAVLGVDLTARAARQTALDLGIETLAWQADASGIGRDIVRVLDQNPMAGVPLRDSVWSAVGQTTTAVTNRINAGVLMGQSPDTISSEIKKYLLDPKGTAGERGVVRRLRTLARKARAAGETKEAKKLSRRAQQRARLLGNPGRGNYRSAHTNAMRVVRTHMIRAYQESAHEYGQRKRWVGAYYWYPNPKACPICVAMEGYYALDSCPVMPHPQCGCRVEQVSKMMLAKLRTIELRRAPSDLTGQARRLWAARQFSP